MRIIVMDKLGRGQITVAIWFALAVSLLAGCGTPPSQAGSPQAVQSAQAGHPGRAALPIQPQPGQTPPAGQPGLFGPPRTDPPSPFIPAPPPARISGKVVLDPGHGGKDPGTRSSGGALEKNVNLAVAQAAAQYLRRRGVEVTLTRQNDTFVELSGRCAVANDWPADIFVSIHADSSRKADASGHSVLLPQAGSSRSTRLGNLISAKLVQAGSAEHVVRRDDRGLFVLKNTRCPAILVELGFLSNDSEATRLADPVQQSRLGWAISEGIAQYLAGAK